jgi:hypothetical protein
MATTFIPDGYTVDGYIAEIPRRHGAVRFRYRPCVATENMIGANAITKAVGPSPAKAEMIAATIIAKQLVEWDVTAPTKPDEVLDITAENVARVHPTIGAKLLGIIRGTDASDLDPDAVENRGDEQEGELERLLSGVEAPELEPEGN